jgi:curli biogenesis system outer membrane secretion channel CsgG
VAVLDFEHAAAQQGVSNIFFQSAAPNLGKAVADLLVTRLVQNATVSVIERAALDKLLEEQNLSNSDRTDPLTAAKIGRVLGVDAMILGSITQYDYEDKMTGGGGGFGSIIGRGSTSTKHDLRARVKIGARLVSPDTAEVLAVSQGAGEIVRKNVKVDMRDPGRLMGINMGTVNIPIMNEAMDKAVALLATELNPHFPKLPPRGRVIEGLVADANESGRLILNVGARDGLKTGDRLEVWRSGKEIRDPATGRLLLRDDTLLGEAVVGTVNDTSAIAAYEGKEAVKVSDIVKTPSKKP